jgi:hypothetical protein
LLPQCPCHQRNQPVKLAVIVAANALKYPSGELAFFEISRTSDNTQIIQCHADDSADCAIAVVAALIDFWSHLKHPPEQIKGFAGFCGRHMRHDCSALHVEIIGQLSDPSPVDKGSGFGN